MDAVIATGSDNSARYFEHYFGKYPHIIRKNRNGVAVLTGQETAADLTALGNDIFRFSAWVAGTYQNSTCRLTINSMISFRLRLAMPMS